MALYVVFENENTFLFLYFIWLLLNLQMCQIILPDPVLCSRTQFLSQISYTLYGNFGSDVKIILKETLALKTMLYRIICYSGFNKQKLSRNELYF